MFQSVTGDTLILRVHWPPTASGMIVRPPAMTLAGVEARHAWIDSRNMRITGYDPIQTSDAWIDANLLLGVAVHTVIQHLQLNPPTILRFVDPGLIAIQTKKSATAANATSPPPPPPAYHDSMVKPIITTQHHRRMPTIDWPIIPAHFSELDSLSRERLEELIQNELEFRTFTNQLDIMQQYSVIQQQQLSKNVSIAKANLQYENQIEQLHATITKLQEELRSKVQAFQALEQQQDQILQPPAVSTIVRDLTRAKKEAYVQSEQIAEQWLESLTTEPSSSLEQNNTSIATFMESFMAVRKLQHVRAAKLELVTTTRSSSSPPPTNGTARIAF